MIEKTISVGSKMIKLRSSAAIPRIYRLKFQRDIFRDLMYLQKTFEDNKKMGQDFQIPDLEIFENVAYIMSKHADKEQPDDIEAWLEQFDMFDVYQILPEILELWNLNTETQIEAKKNR